MEPEITVLDAILQGTRLLESASVAAPRLNAEVLLAHAIGCSREWLYAHSTDRLKELWWIHYGRYLNERMSGKPTQYITRKQEFYGREFRVSPAVLIPRPETEFVIEAALTRKPSGPMLDIGCGSGAIAVTLSLETECPVFASDISRAALEVARDNNARLGGHVEFVEADLATCFASATFQFIASNPPYVPDHEKEHLQREVRDFEPHVALFGGPDGMANYRRIVTDAARLLQPGGWLILELAFDASERVAALFTTGWRDIELTPDLAGYPRVIAARWLP